MTFTLSILEDTLTSYLENKLDDIPTLKMLNTPVEELEKRAGTLKNSIDSICDCEVIKTQSLIGGGTTPNKKIPTIALSISYKDYKANKIEKILRNENLITRIEKEKVLIDFRSIQENEIKRIEAIIKKVFN